MRKALAAAAIVAGLSVMGLTACHDSGSPDDINRTAHVCTGTDGKTLTYEHWSGGEVTGHYVRVIIPNAAECVGTGSSTQ